jgi:hypothetical protein
MNGEFAPRMARGVMGFARELRRSCYSEFWGGESVMITTRGISSSEERTTNVPTFLSSAGILQVENMAP